MNRLLAMSGFTEFISFIPYEARYLEHDELIRRKPTRVGAARELMSADLDICVHGSDRGGAYYGFFRWSDYMRKPRIAGNHIYQVVTRRQLRAPSIDARGERKGVVLVGQRGAAKFLHQ